MSLTIHWRFGRHCKQRWLVPLIIGVLLHSAMGFLVVPPRSRVHSSSRAFPQQQPLPVPPALNRINHCYVRKTRLYAIADETDPFRILNLEPNPDLDKKAIKRAYKRMALKFHPDVVTNQNSSEKEKRRANDDFARINWAYETLIGKNQDEAAASTSASSAGGYTPPHRRKGAYASAKSKTTTTGGGASTDWRDYMPKYDEEDYNAGGDSFGAIFSDLFAGAAGAAAMGAAGVKGGSGGIFRDFVEFLERNVDGYSGGEQDDAQLTVLLQTGSLEEIAMEMDDTELVVQQLSSKIDNIQQEYMTVTEEAKLASKYLERLELEEAAEELKARQKVSEGYLKKARKRLVKLQTRYKQLIVGGEDDIGVGGGRRRSAASSTQSSWDTDTTNTDRNTRVPRGDDDNEEDAWKHEGFGSSGRGRGSSRRRRSSGSRSRRTTAQPDSRDFSSRQSTTRKQTTASSRPRDQQTTRKATTTSSPTPPSEPWTPPVPPHRRKSSSTSQAQADKRRLRQLKVEDDFDNLKKDLGL